jgi:uncharacterized protein YlxW (UPF0749 family)
MREREGLITRIRQIRRVAAAADKPSSASTNLESDELRSLEARVAHLEHMIEGFQDSVHRESARQAKIITELEARTQPAAMSAALSKDARERGL